MEEFFAEMSNNSNLKSLRIESFKNLSSIDPQVLTKVLTQIEVVSISHTKITNDQEMSLLSEMASGNAFIKAIDLGGNNLSSVDPEVLARAVTRLECL